MGPTTSRRRLLLAVPALVLGGCTARDGGRGTQTTTTTPTPTDEQMTSTDDGTPDPQEMIDRLPEPSPLGTSLRDLVLAKDRQEFATGAGIPFRDGAVKVELELDEGGDPPRALLEEVETEYGTMVVAWVRIDVLVDVALAPEVRIVRSYSEPAAHGIDPSQ